MSEDLIPVEEVAHVSLEQVEVSVSSNKTVVMRALNGADIRTVNRLTGQNIGNSGENQMLYSIVSINGEKVVPVKNEMHFDNRAARFNAREYVKLMEEFGKAFYEDITDPK